MFRLLAVVCPSLVAAAVVTVTAIWMPPSYGQCPEYALRSSPASVTSTIPSINVTGTVPTGVITVVVQLPSDIDTDADMYERVATTAIGASRDVLDITKWLIGAITALVGAAASLLVAFFTYISNRVQEASKAATESSTSASAAAESAESSVNVVKDLSTRLEDLHDSVQQSIGQMEEAQRQLSIRLEEFDQELEKRRRLAEQDIVLQKKSLALLKLDECGMSIRSEDPGQRWKGITVALEMSFREDSIIRRKAVRVLGTLEECDMRVVERLEGIIANDRARGVRQEAEKALKKLQQLCDEKHTEQGEKSAPG